MQDLPALDRAAWPKPPRPWTNRAERVEAATPQGLQDRSFHYHINTIGMPLVRIEPGNFLMGLSPRLMRQLRFQQQTGHPVTLTKPFYLGAFEVTNRQYEQSDASHAKRRPPYQRGPSGDDHPVQPVTWQEAQRFCRWLSQREGRLYRLPTEAEWEYACKAGTSTRLYWGDAFWDRNKANTFGLKTVRETWSEDGYRFTAPVGCYPPNPWGLYDMVGNAREWVQDWYEPYPTNAEVDPTGPANTGRYRVMKGSGWMTQVRFLAGSTRDGNNAADRHDVNGFRVLCEAEAAAP
jgi:formylglycine-generating enzyme required for sulfatase activity